jgi:uncharacterized protein (TIGR02444 family)
MPLWDWAVEAYGRPGAERACLALQDEHDQNVPYLLWAAWARSCDRSVLDRAADIALRWEVLAVGPIRMVRRALKPGFSGVPEAARQALRDDVKAAELRAERVLLESLEALGPPGDAEILPTLRAASAAWGNVAPANALAALADALG